MEPQGQTDAPPSWPRPDESFAAPPPPQPETGSPAPPPSPAAGGAATETVNVLLVLRSGQDALELGSFDDPSRATEFAMGLRRFLRAGTTISLDIVDQS